MLHLEEHRDVGDGVETANRLAIEHEDYSAMAMVIAPRCNSLLIYVFFSPTSMRRELFGKVEKSYLACRSNWS